MCGKGVVEDENHAEPITPAERSPPSARWKKCGIADPTAVPYSSHPVVNINSPRAGEVVSCPSQLGGARRAGTSLTHATGMLPFIPVCGDGHPSCGRIDLALLCHQPKLLVMPDPDCPSRGLAKKTGEVGTARVINGSGTRPSWYVLPWRLLQESLQPFAEGVAGRPTRSKHPPGTKYDEHDEQGGVEQRPWQARTSTAKIASRRRDARKQNTRRI